jgi:hypothetical protein
VSSAATDLSSNLTLDVGRLAAIGQIAHVLLAGETHQHPQSLVVRDIEQLAGRHRVRDSDGVEPIRGHRRKVALDPLQISVLET